MPGIDQFIAPNDFLATFEEIDDLYVASVETLDGVLTKGLLDRVGAAAAGGGDAVNPMAGFGDFGDIPTGFTLLPVSIWIYDEQRIRRFAMSVDDFIEGQPFSFAMTYDLFGYGESVSIDIPDASEVTVVDGESLLSDFGATDFDTGSSFGQGNTYGDDPALDAYWDVCADGDVDACDPIYFESPFDSEYELFGATCGFRFEPTIGQLCSRRSQASLHSRLHPIMPGRWRRGVRATGGVNRRSPRTTPNGPIPPPQQNSK